MSIDQHYEYLVKLYLRLKGYVVTNLIIHSDEPGTSKSELDIIGIRMPYHKQEERWVKYPDYLNSSDTRIEVLIADVKNYGSTGNLKFNKGLRKDRQSIKQLIDWLGVFPNVSDVIDEFEDCLNLHKMKDSNFTSFNKDFDHGNFAFTFTFFCPSLPEWDGVGPKYIHGKEIIDFIYECLNDKKQIASCSRRYNYAGWNELEKYVLFFKDIEQEVTKENLECYFKVLKK